MNGETKKSDLGVRTASAVVMVAVAGTALWLGSPVWDIFVLVVALVCMAEFFRLILKATPNPWYRGIAILAAAIYVLIAGFQLVTHRSGWLHDVNGYAGMMAAGMVVGIVIFTDVGAYFSGRAIGGPKIAPSISPNKTWAGLIGGMLAASLWTTLAFGVFYSSSDDTFFNPTFFGSNLTMFGAKAAVIGAGLAVVAQAGDFFQSWLKRKAKVKDSSNLIPGHGGVFDRVDGLLAVLFVTIFFPPGGPI